MILSITHKDQSELRDGAREERRNKAVLCRVRQITVYHCQLSRKL